MHKFGLPLWLSCKKSACNTRDTRDAGLIPGLERSLGGVHGNPLQLFSPGESHGKRSLVGYSPQSRKESDTTEATEDACISLMNEQIAHQSTIQIIRDNLSN